MEVRKPTEEEKCQIIEYLWLERYSYPTVEDFDEQQGLVERSAIAVFEEYITDCPGYGGKVLVVVWPGSPGMTETYIWQKGKIARCANEM